ncbi:hypothetical protein J2Y69_003539 [Microbacterium resistens]|uniref:Helicase XPB/Ssl2 N-terminal domain-containing protein n=1 Tax=Microbacterium resistens TaxID=156977 RepID=A0ABU1SIT3_9MICO|nr:helicase-associated domain-containing protein [Microbacterium resistens]MDR6868913.1 hypothetical protein [Microbacterium resistens]
MSTHARPLAEALAARADAELVALFSRREVRAGIGWEDFFDAAEALLEPASIGRLIPRLTRDEARALFLAVRGGGATDSADPGLIALALLSPSGLPYPGVAAVVGGLADPGDPPPAAAEGSRATDEQSTARAAERAFTAVAVLADLLLLTQETPLGLLAGGSVGASEKRRAVERGLPGDPALIDDLLAIGIEGGLLRAAERSLRLTVAGEEWLRLPGAERWAGLARGFEDALPPALRRPGGGWPDPSTWAGAYPWDPAWPDAASARLRRAELLGLIVDGEPTPWAAPLIDGSAPDLGSLRALLPAEVDRVFLQNDLSAIAPGPLLPALDLRLRTMSERESANQASSYRFTADSIAAALAIGETEDGILSFLDEISLTEVPQPLRYLIAQGAQRHGLVRIVSDPMTGRTRVESTDAHLIDALGVDQSLRPLGLVRDGASLSTRVSRETVFWALTDEHYPAALIGADGRDERASRVPPLAADPAQDPVARYDELIRRLRAAQGPDADAAWLDRELEHAVRQRAVLIVEVAMPDGSSKELLLEVTGLGGGRLRGRDRAADVERTLPIRSIRSTRLVGPENAGA